MPGLVVEDLADVDAVLDELGAGGLDVGDDEVQTLDEPGAAAVMPVPKMIEHPEPGGVNCTIRKPLSKGKSASSRQPSAVERSSPGRRPRPG